MDPTIAVALITTIGGVVTVFVQNIRLGRRLDSVKSDTHEVRARTRNIDTQVTNSHTENFRVEVTDGFTAIHDRLDQQAGDIRGLKFQVAGLQNRFTKHIDRGD